jgi:hypothetical protein
MVRGSQATKRKMLRIEVSWSKPMEVVDDSAGKLIYAVEDVEDVPDIAGVYVFARLFGSRVIPLYIGETGNIRTRLKQHLKNNVRLMKGIQGAPNGRLIFLFGEVRLRRGQNVKKVRSVLQRTIIERALSEGHELLNDKGAKTPVHSVRSTGNRYSEQIAGRLIFCPK